MITLAVLVLWLPGFLTRVDEGPHAATGTVGEPGVMRGLPRDPAAQSRAHSTQLSATERAEQAGDAVVRAVGALLGAVGRRAARQQPWSEATSKQAGQDVLPAGSAVLTHPRHHARLGVPGRSGHG